MNKLLIICGPTATGKTAVALKVANLLGGELISADARQVYKGMDVGTGKDIPLGATWRQADNFPFGFAQGKQLPIGFWETREGVRIWGYDVVEPDEEFSVAHFVTLAWKIIPYLWEQGTVPILVGGTGLYLESVVTPPQTLWITPNPRLRNELEKLSVTRLQARLKKEAPEKFERFTSSDQQNPRRLIRAIEVAESVNIKRSMLPPTIPLVDTLWVGVRSPLKALDTRIEIRVKERARKGMTEEARKIWPKLHKSVQARSSFGYHEWHQFLEGTVSRTQAEERWVTAEKQYARRQLTWFKKRKNIQWFDSTQPRFRQKLVAYIKTWYAGGVHGERNSKN